MELSAVGDLSMQNFTHLLPLAAVLALGLSSCQTHKTDTANMPALDYPFDEHGNYIESKAKKLGNSKSKTKPVSTGPTFSANDSGTQFLEAPEPIKVEPKPSKISAPVENSAPDVARITVPDTTESSAVPPAPLGNYTPEPSPNGQDASETTEKLANSGTSKPKVSESSGTTTPKPKSSTSKTKSSPKSKPSTIYTVAKGDTLSAIAKRHDTTVAAIRAANDLDSANLIRVGQKLKISGESKVSQAVNAKKSKSSSSTKKSASSTVTVKPGDSLWSIARKHDTTVNALKKANNLTSDVLLDGQKIKVP